MGLKLYQNAYDIINQYLFGGIDRNTSSVNYSGIGTYVKAKSTDGTISPLYASLNSSGPSPAIYTLGGKSYIYASSMEETDFNFLSYNNDNYHLFSLAYNSYSRSIYSTETIKEYIFTIPLNNTSENEVTVNSIDFQYQDIISSQTTKYILWATYFLDEPITLAAGESNTVTIKITTTLPEADPDLIS